MARVIHFEVLGEDPEKTAEFYKQALGWEANSWPGGEQTYWLCTTGPEGPPGINGAIMGKHFGQPVINTVEAESLEEATANIEKAGGKRVTQPSEIPEVGLHAYFEDPDGTLFGVLQPAPES
jgi:hypothetical protein